MSYIAGFLGAIGLGDQAGYSFSQQQKDFIKLQFKYGLLLKQKLDAGQITQAYYDQNFWLTTQSLDAPYNGWWDEFKTAIQSEDLQWLSKQVGESVADLTAFMGDALHGVAKAIGSAVGTAVSASAGGLASGFFGSLGLAGWLVVGAAGFGVWYAWKKGLIKKLASHELNKLIP